MDNQLKYRQLEGNRIWLPLFTLTGWASLLTVGLLGAVLPYIRPVPSLDAADPVSLEILEIELDPDSDTILDPDHKSILPEDLLPPPVPASMESPALTDVAEINPDIEFPLPIPLPATVDDARKASSSSSMREIRDVPDRIPSVTRLQFGRGDGRQPAPRYPLKALREGQEGNVTIQFTVGTTGRVVSTEIVKPSPWYLLNQEASRVIKSRWRFPSGNLRRYEIELRFQISG